MLNLSTPAFLDTSNREAVKNSLGELARILKIEADFSKSTPDLLKDHQELSQRLAKLLEE